jgi:hypothetical protein
MNSHQPVAASISWTVRRTVIERQRVLKGWTRSQLAEAAHIDPKTLRDLLGGRRRPTLGTVGTVARAIDLPLPRSSSSMRAPDRRAIWRRCRMAVPNRGCYRCSERAIGQSCQAGAERDRA